AQNRRPGHAVGSTRRMEPNLLRMLAANARFLLFAHDERHRLESDARQICRVATVREPPQRSYLLVRRARRRIKQWPHLRRRRRAPRHSAYQAWFARGGIFARPGDPGLSDRTHFAGRKL